MAECRTGLFRTDVHIFPVLCYNESCTGAEISHTEETPACVAEQAPVIRVREKEAVLISGSAGKAPAFCARVENTHREGRYGTEKNSPEEGH